jgi:hypothetical protein
MHKLSNGIAKLTGCVDASFAAIFQEVLLELEGTFVSRYPTPTCKGQTHEISITVYKDKHKRIALLVDY